MILNKEQILDEYKKGNIIYKSELYKLEDFANNQSVDIHLGDNVCIVTGNNNWLNLNKFPEGINIPKGTFFLCHTEEFIGSAANSNILPEFHQRSTWARLGLIHTKAGWGDVGYHNKWTMEYYTATPVTLKKGDRLGQITFTRTEANSGDYTKKGSYQTNKEWSKEDILPNNNNR